MVFLFFIKEININIMKFKQKEILVFTMGYEKIACSIEN